jgi:hypothetical protein
MRTKQTKRRYDDVASFAQESEMPDLSRLIVSVTNDTLFGLAHGTGLYGSSYFFEEEVNEKNIQKISKGFILGSDR